MLQEHATNEKDSIGSGKYGYEGGAMAPSNSKQALYVSLIRYMQFRTLRTNLSWSHCIGPRGAFEVHAIPASFAGPVWYDDELIYNFTTNPTNFEVGWSGVVGLFAEGE